MWYNPSTWAPVDKVQNFVGDLGKTNVSFGPGGGQSTFWGSQSATKSTPQVLGASTVNVNAQPMSQTVQAPQPSSAPVTAAWTPDTGAVRQFDQSINSAQSALDRLNPALDIARGNVNRQYDVNYNELLSGRNQAEQQYGQSTDSNKQQYVTSKNQIADMASQGLRGLQRMLGSRGAGGSSDAIYKAPDAVAEVATQQRSGASQTFGENQQNLDTNWNTFLSGFDNGVKKLNDWKTQTLNSVETQSLTNKANLLQTLAELNAKRSAYAGGDATASAQPFLDQISQIGNRVNELTAFNPTYTGTTPVYNAPTTESYTVAENRGPQFDNTARGDQLGSYLNLLLGRRDKQTPVMA